MSSPPSHQIALATDLNTNFTGAEILDVCSGLMTGVMNLYIYLFRGEGEVVGL